MNVITNNVPRLLLDYNQLTEAEKVTLGSADDQEGDYVRYRGLIFNCKNFNLAPEEYADKFEGIWHCKGGSYLVRYMDSDHVIMGHTA